MVNVVDGDTIDVVINGVSYSLRYIGMDSPENTLQVEYFGNEATNKNKELVDGKVLTLVKDVSDRDRLDHLLRYVFVGDIFVNYELVKQGYANAKAYPPDTACQETFTDAETLARETGLGIWAVSVATATSPAASTGGSNVKITTIFVDGSGQNEPDEYVEIRNDGSQPLQLQGWTLQDKANHVFLFPSFVMEPGQTCRVYTNENHPESCGFSFYNSGSAVWNNSGDCAYLSDSQGNQVDDYCY